MYDYIIIDVVIWFVVFSLCLIIALRVYKFAYHKYLAYRNKIEGEEAVRRYEKQSNKWKR